MGKPYRWGGAGPRSYDCSGLSMAAWRRGGVPLPHRADIQYHTIRRKVPINHLRPGDLIFFSGARHVGIYVGHGRFVHAPHTGTVVQRGSLTGWRRRAFAGAARPGAPAYRVWPRWVRSLATRPRRRISGSMSIPTTAAPGSVSIPRHLARAASEPTSVPAPHPSTTPTAPASAPAASAPAGSAPARSAPAGSAPARSAPAGSASAGSAPAGSAPARPVPARSVPAASAPAGSASAASAPAASAPAGSAPVGSAPAGSAPTVLAPAASAPAGSASTGSAPAASAPAGSASAAPVPVGSAAAPARPSGGSPEPAAAGAPRTAFASGPADGQARDDGAE
ncbi:NlpC/P60 family protein [Actinoallomurus sp. CA-150999]|uniref:C40 family peptidase n=1 Tax=Actinoallomurus sp. CA-150999 TaxID=3239887 RepID=UPI003D8E1153